MVSETPINVLVSCSPRCCVSRTHIVWVVLSVSLGFVLLDFWLCLLVLRSHVAVILFCPCLSLVSFSSDDAGRFVLCGFRFHEKLFRVVSLYAPNRNLARDQFLDQVSSWVDPAVPTVICGNFNKVLDRSLDRTGYVFSDTSREYFYSLSFAWLMLRYWYVVVFTSLLLGLYRDASRWLCLFSYRSHWLSICVGSLHLVVWNCSVPFLWPLCCPLVCYYSRCCPPGSRVVETEHLYPGRVGLCPLNWRSLVPLAWPEEAFPFLSQVVGSGQVLH